MSTQQHSSSSSSVSSSSGSSSSTTPIAHVPTTTTKTSIVDVANGEEGFSSMPFAISSSAASSVFTVGQQQQQQQQQHQLSGVFGLLQMLQQQQQQQQQNQQLASNNNGEVAKHRIFNQESSSTGMAGHSGMYFAQRMGVPLSTAQQNKTNNIDHCYYSSMLKKVGGLPEKRPRQSEVTTRPMDNLLVNSMMGQCSDYSTTLSSAASSGTIVTTQDFNLTQQQPVLLESSPLSFSFPAASTTDGGCFAEKRKFSADISDRLVAEVLARRQLLVEHNTSRELQFSAQKRQGWEDVRALLIHTFPGFDMNVEAIKSHWRYRKRKVVELFERHHQNNSEWGKDGEGGELSLGELDKLRGHTLGLADRSIFQMLFEQHHHPHQQHSSQQKKEPAHEQRLQKEVGVSSFGKGISDSTDECSKNNNNDNNFLTLHKNKIDQRDQQHSVQSPIFRSARHEQQKQHRKVNEEQQQHQMLAFLGRKRKRSRKKDANGEDQQQNQHHFGCLEAKQQSKEQKSATTVEQLLFPGLLQPVSMMSSTSVSQQQQQSPQSNSQQRGTLQLLKLLIAARSLQQQQHQQQSSHFGGQHSCLLGAENDVQSLLHLHQEEKNQNRPMYQQQQERHEHEGNQDQHQLHQGNQGSATTTESSTTTSTTVTAMSPLSDRTTTTPHQCGYTEKGTMSGNSGPTTTTALSMSSEHHQKEEFFHHHQHPKSSSSARGSRNNGEKTTPTVVVDHNGNFEGSLFGESTTKTVNPKTNDHANDDDQDDGGGDDEMEQEGNEVDVHGDQEEGSRRLNLTTQLATSEAQLQAYVALRQWVLRLGPKMESLLDSALNSDDHAGDGNDV